MIKSCIYVLAFALKNWNCKRYPHSRKLRKQKSIFFFAEELHKNITEFQAT